MRHPCWCSLVRTGENPSVIKVHRMSFPQLWFSKKSVETGISFEEPFSEKNCLGWNAVPLQELNSLAQRRIDHLNSCMPGKWEYSIIGWRIEGPQGAPCHDHDFCDVNCSWTDHHPDCDLGK